LTEVGRACVGRIGGEWLAGKAGTQRVGGIGDEGNWDCDGRTV